MELGLCDELVPLDELAGAAHARATTLARTGPLALRAIRETMRGDLAALVRAATDREVAEQNRLERTNDFTEGVAAYAERHKPNFTAT